ncbi:hypothetical protein VNO78_20730 [Psophocarpus tetragonolobus]|uniref:RING-type domain-containing protein n=1 Tax=Psophocarpus tetragonolobus TaxID=3891 RepID=A0AAN9SAX2_PSOTE
MDPESQARYARNGKLMFGSTILVFLIVITGILVHTFRHWCFRRRHRRGFRTDSSVKFSDALCPSLLKFLPTFTYSSDTHRSLQDCTICLYEFNHGEEGRVLPNCNHVFHAHCVDTWFRSHSNCPLCRTPVHRHPAPVQPSSNLEPGLVGRLSSIPAPIWSPRKSLELVGIIVQQEGHPDSEPGPDISASELNV